MTTIKGVAFRHLDRLPRVGDDVNVEGVRMIRLFGERGDLLAFLVFTPLLLVFGEIVPKSVYQQKSDDVAPASRWRRHRIAPSSSCASSRQERARRHRADPSERNRRRARERRPCPGAMLRKPTP